MQDKSISGSPLAFEKISLAIPQYPFIKYDWVEKPREINVFPKNRTQLPLPALELQPPTQPCVLVSLFSDIMQVKLFFLFFTHIVFYILLYAVISSVLAIVSCLISCLSVCLSLSGIFNTISFTYLSLHHLSS